MTEQPLRILSSMATRGVLAKLAARYQQTTGVPVVAEAGGGVDVAKRVQAGEVVDVVVLADRAIERLMSQGGLLSGTRQDIADSPIAIAVSSGSAAAPPDVHDEDAVRRAVQSAATLSYSTGPSGTWLEETFARWGMLDELRARIVVPPPGVPVAQMVAEGRAQLGFQQLSELMNQPGVAVIGLLPDDIQLLTTFAGAIATSCTRRDDAAQLLDFLASEQVADEKLAFGLRSPAIAA